MTIGNSYIDRLAKELCNVWKDHNNVLIQNLVKYLFNYCYTRKLTECVSDWSDKEKNFVLGDRIQCEKIQDLHLTKAVRLVLVNKQDFWERLGSIDATLQKDGLQFAYHTWKIISHL